MEYLKRCYLYVALSFVLLLSALFSFYPVTANANDIERWRFSTESKVNSSPVIGTDGTVYVGSYDHKLYAVDPIGKEKWSFETEEVITSKPAIGSDGTIYVGSWDNRLYAINPKNGKKKWSFETEDKLLSSPAVGADGTIYVGSNDKRLYAIQPDGKKKWHFETGEWVSSSPTIGSDGTIYVGSNDRKLYAIKPNGKEKWHFETGAAVQSSPAMGADGTIYFGSDDHYLYAIDTEIGKEKWRFATGDAVVSSPAVGVDGTIYVGSLDGRLYAIKSDGQEKWQFKTNQPVYSSPAVGSDGTIYFGSLDNKLYAIKANGKEKWRFNTGAEILSLPAIGPDGAVYVGSADKNLYAIGMISVSGVSLNKTELTLRVGQSGKLEATILPDDATYQGIKWSSREGDIAKVDDSGKVTGVAPGKTMITATTEDGGYFKQCVVTVTEEIDLPAKEDIALTDIDRHWAKANIIQAVSEGIVKGYPDGTFKPDRTVTRAEFAVLLMNGLKPSSKGSVLTFTDKETIGSWAAQEIAKCVVLGIIKGYPDGTFRPNKTITHAEMITMIVRAGNLSVVDGATTRYLDDATIPEYARSSAATAELYGISSYIQDNRFKPNELSTRAESVTAILNMLKVKQ